MADTIDILTKVRPVYSVYLIDLLLNFLTHPKPLLRRASLLLLIGSFYLSIASFLFVRRSLNLPPAIVPTKWDQQDALAAAYRPPPATAQQKENAFKLAELIDGLESGFDWREFSDGPGARGRGARKGVTAVVLHWKRRKGLELVLRQLARYPFIREVIVWNNRPGVDLKVEDFPLGSPPGSSLGPPAVRVFNSPSNVHDAGKHFACAMATYDTCYFNDDDWLNVYLDALYTKYLTCCAPSRDGTGGRIASNTMPVIHVEHKRWRFENPDINLHTGFTWLGTGSFVPKSLSARFLNQQSAAPVGLSQAETLVSDMFFSLWTNTYPEQMPNSLVPIDVEGEEVGWSKSAGVDQWTVVYANILSAVRQLSDILTNSPHLLPSPFPVGPPPPESHLRAPCLSGLCLFSTSLSPFPPPSALTHPSARPHKKGWLGRSKVSKQPDFGVELKARFDPWLVAHVNEYEGRWGGVEGGYPTNKWWDERGSWHLAVDGRGTESCWQSWRAPEAQDHFGLHLVAPRALSTLVLTGSADLADMHAWEDPGAGAQSWHLFTMDEEDGLGWEAREFEAPPAVKAVGRGGGTDSRQVSEEKGGLVEVRMRVVPLEGREGARVRQVKFVSAGRKQARVEVCGWTWDRWQI